MTLPVSLAGKANWSIKDSAAKPLPATAGADAFIWRGDATRFTLTDSADKGVSVVIEHGYQQLQDNRVWHTDCFQWVSFAALPRTGATEAFYTVHVLDAGAAVPAVKQAAVGANPRVRPHPPFHAPRRQNGQQGRTRREYGLITARQAEKPESTNRDHRPDAWLSNHSRLTV